MKIHTRIIPVCLFTLLTVAASATCSDTIFLSPKKNVRTAASKIFINPGNHGWRYDSLKSLGYPSSSVKSKSVYPYGTWIEIKQYQNRYYAYYPCDLGNIYRLNISKDLLRIFRSEEEGYRITYTKKRSDTKYIFETNNPNDHKKETLVLHILDKKKGLAVVEHVGATQSYRYRMVANADNLTQYPMIVN
jgi:hypothetical protein